jgi:hypothetical protein
MPILSPYIIEPIFEQFSAPFCPKEKWITLWAAIDSVSQIGWSLRSWSGCWFSAVLTREDR